MSERHSEEMLDRVSLAALGGLDAAESEVLAEHLASGCTICDGAMRSAARVAGVLGYAAEESEPRPQLRAAVLARIAAEAALEATPEIDSRGVHFARTPSLGWQSTPIPGFAAKLLADDRQRCLRTQLVRLQAGAVIPAHRHVDVEELFVLEGDLIVNDVLMQAGDYCRAAPESVHDASRTPNGCVFLVISSALDKRIENR